MVGLYHGNPGSVSEKYFLSEFPKPNSRVRCMVCTIAFGMGVNIPDIRHVFHWGISANLLAYWQEVGRVGRDGGEAEATLFATARSKYHLPLPSKEMLAFIEKASKGEECLRRLILEGLAMPNMDLGLLSRCMWPPVQVYGMRLLLGMQGQMPLPVTRYVNLCIPWMHIMYSVASVAARRRWSACGARASSERVKSM